jgi:hypothetical protein
MRFNVTPSELESLAGGLSGLLGDLSSAGNVRTVSAAPAENAQLQGAIEELIAHWCRDVDTLRAQLAELGEKVNRAGVGYSQAEQLITETAVGVSVELGGHQPEAPS